MGYFSNKSKQSHIGKFIARVRLAIFCKIEWYRFYTVHNLSLSNWIALSILIELIHKRIRFESNFWSKFLNSKNNCHYKIHIIGSGSNCNLQKRSKIHWFWAKRIENDPIHQLFWLILTIMIKFYHFRSFNWHFNQILVKNWGNLIKNWSKIDQVWSKRDQ